MASKPDKFEKWLRLAVAASRAAVALGEFPLRMSPEKCLRKYRRFKKEQKP